MFAVGSVGWVVGGWWWTDKPFNVLTNIKKSVIDAGTFELLINSKQQIQSKLKSQLRECNRHHTYSPSSSLLSLSWASRGSSGSEAGSQGRLSCGGQWQSGAATAHSSSAAENVPWRDRNGDVARWAAITCRIVADTLPAGRGTGQHVDHSATIRDRIIIHR